MSLINLECLPRQDHPKAKTGETFLTFAHHDFYPIACMICVSEMWFLSKCLQKASFEGNTHLQASM